MNVFRGEKLIYHAVYGYFGYAEMGGKTYGYFGGLTLMGSGSPTAEFDSGAGYVDHGHTDLYRVDLDTGRATKVTGGNELLRKTWLVSPRGVVGPHSDYETKTGKWRLFADLDAGQKITEAMDPAGDIDLVGFGPREGTVVVQAPGRVARATGNLPNIRPPPAAPARRFSAISASATCCSIHRRAC